MKRVCLALLLLLSLWSAAASAQVACVAGTPLDVEWNGTWYAATVVAGPDGSGQCQIHYEGYDASWDEWVTAARMRPRTGAPVPTSPCAPGAQSDVLWNGYWYAATTIGGPNETGQCQIHYDGWDAQWDEWVGADRMRPRQPLCVPGQGIEVAWNGQYYPATVLSGTDTACMIHYDGYESSWDESVGIERMRYRN